MFHDAFIKLDSTQAAKMVELVNPKLDIKYDPARATVMVHNLSFYPDYFVVELANHDENPPLIRLAICNDKGEVHVLNWTNVPIFLLNKKVPITLKGDALIDYVRFFFTFVRGKHGRFLIVDTVDDIDWREEPAPAGRKALAKMIEPMQIKRKESDGTVVLSASIVFKDSLFAGEIHVKPDGNISMQNEELMVEDIPVADDIFGA
jgi:hypothetical protein